MFICSKLRKHHVTPRPLALSRGKLGSIKQFVNVGLNSSTLPSGGRPLHFTKRLRANPKPKSINFAVKVILRSVYILNKPFPTSAFVSMFTVGAYSYTPYEHQNTNAVGDDVLTS
jgi:hypothetical protein